MPKANEYSRLQLVSKMLRDCFAEYRPIYLPGRVVNQGLETVSACGLKVGGLGIHAEYAGIYLLAKESSQKSVYLEYTRIYLLALGQGSFYKHAVNSI